ncbi:MAG TPA: hypothetical protein VEB18_00385 [Candidatus Paceibacterota bacterium]|nr:hypothetical protein [Candidatus Paceibacterota bacterium]
MKTIFISIFDGDTERVILRTDVFRVLKESGHKIVLLVRSADRIEHYQREFANEQVAVELLPPSGSRQETLWYYAGWNSIPTHAVAVRRIREYWNTGKYHLFVIGSIAGILAHSRVWREFLRLLYRVFGESYAEALFEKYRPDLLFAANMFSPEDSRLLLTARRRKVPSVTIAKSWDVLTTKAFTRVKADRLLVYNEFNKKEASQYGDYPPSRVVVVGFPQFDIYTREDIFLPREAFLEKVGLNPAARYALYGIPGDWKSPDTRPIIAMLDEQITQGAFVEPFQVLARFHPKYRDSTEGLQTTNVVFDKPGKYFAAGGEFSLDSGKDANQWTFKDDDVIHLANSLRHADVIINVDSTLTLDAMANRKPAIIIAYDGDRKLPYRRSIAFIYEREHYRNVIKTGAVPLARSHTHLVQLLNTFLENPEYLQAERDVLTERMLYKLDGRSGERAGQAILTVLAS